MEREEVPKWLKGAQSAIYAHVPGGIAPKLLHEKPLTEYAALAHALALINRVELRLKGEAIGSEDLAAACGTIQGILWVYGLYNEGTPL